MKAVPQKQQREQQAQWVEKMRQMSLSNGYVAGQFVYTPPRPRGNSLRPHVVQQKWAVRFACVSSVRVLQLVSQFEIRFSRDLLAVILNFNHWNLAGIARNDKTLTNLIIYCWRPEGEILKAFSDIKGLTWLVTDGYFACRTSWPLLHPSQMKGRLTDMAF